MHVLILEDDLDFAETLVDALVMHGHTAAIEVDVAGAQQMLESDQLFDVVVLDVNLDHDNSTNLLRYLTEKCPLLRVISITGGGAVSAKIGLPLSKAIAEHTALFKPFAIEEFLEAINEAS